MIAYARLSIGLGSLAAEAERMILRLRLFDQIATRQDYMNVQSLGETGALLGGHWVLK